VWDWVLGMEAGVWSGYLDGPAVVAVLGCSSVDGWCLQGRYC
jgi:hypothetical protein